jgi:hypothetical protein
MQNVFRKLLTRSTSQSKVSTKLVANNFLKMSLMIEKGFDHHSKRLDYWMVIKTFYGC